MPDKKLLEKLNQLGFGLLETSEDFDVNQTLSEVIAAQDARLMEGFPVMLLNATKDNKFDLEEVNRLLKGSLKKCLNEMLILSGAVYRFYCLKFHWAKRMLDRMSAEEKERVSEYKQYLSEKKEFLLCGKQLRSTGVLQAFDNYCEEEALVSKKKTARYQELSLEYALSQVFSPKQKELFIKKVNGQKLTKTEKEYFSRRVKKKAQALANAELHSLSKRLLE
jgi:hypothetical protein